MSPSLRGRGSGRGLRAHGLGPSPSRSFRASRAPRISPAKRPLRLGARRGALYLQAIVTFAILFSVAV